MHTLVIARRLALLVSVFLAGTAAAESFGGQAAPLSRYAGDARSLSMGNAVVSLANDPGTILVNPTGAAYSEKGVAAGNVLVLPMDRRIYTIGYAKQLDRVAGISVNWVHGSVDNVKGYDSSGDPVGDLSNSENMLVMTFARKIQRFSLGVSAKYYRMELSSIVTSGWGFDLGASTIVTPSIRLGAAARNLLGNVRWDTDTSTGQLQTEETVPRTFVVGGSYMLPSATMAFAVDYERIRDEGQYINLGFSWHGFDALFLRAGYRWLPLDSGSHDGQFTAGASVNINPGSGRLSFDYAVLDDPFGLVHTVGLRYAL